MRLVAIALLASLLLQLYATALLAAEPGSSTAPGVVVAEAERVAYPLRIEALGTTQANESVDIRPAMSERIVAIRFEEGEEVEAGRVLVELESAESRAEVASARATLAESESQLRRTQELFKTNAVSASELEQRETRRDADRAALDAAQARLANTRLKAPFAGVLGLRNVSLGSYATPDTVITTLDDTATIKLDFAVPETVLARLEGGLPVEARSAAFPERRFTGRVASIDTRVDPVSRTLTVRALLANEDRSLRPGMFLTVALLRENVTAIVVPESAIVPERSQQFVWVVGADLRVERRAVATGRRAPGLVEVSEGLAEGETVVIEGTQKARPGETVTVVERRPVGALAALEGLRPAGESLGTSPERSSEAGPPGAAGSP